MKWSCSSGVPVGSGYRHLIRAAVVAVMILACPLGTVKEAGGQPGPRPPERYVSIDFNGVDIGVFIKFISELTGTNFVVDGRVKGKVTILSPARISVDEAYRVFESVLEVHGFTTVKSGKITKIVPAPDARTKSIETLLRQEAGTPDDKVVTQLIPLHYADAEAIKRLFAPLVSKSSVILAYPPTNMLIVTDIYSNILRLLHILETIDVSGIGRELTMIAVSHADAVKMVKLLDSVFNRTRKAKKGEPAPELRFVADERTNTIVVLASEDETRRIRSLVAMLDKEMPKSGEKIRVYYLEYAVAEELSKVLEALAGRTSRADEGKREAPVVSGQVQITADKATNSLIISADREDYRVLEDIIRQLDIPRSMVYIEALIMEVNVDKDFSIGTEWSAGEGTTFDDKAAVFGGSFRLDSGNLLTGQSTSLPEPTGFSLGVFGEAVRIAGFTFPNIQAIIRAYKKDKDVNILSTPQILTTDNKEAKITVGKNVPFQTRTSTTDNDTYNSFEYKDVGKTLKITPQISKDRMVRLTLSLEVTDLESESAEVQFRPTTLKRTVDTTVIVGDGNTVVIGGLIDDSLAVTEQQVPCLGDIPLFNRLFGSSATSNTRTNLYVFLTPHVIENPVEAKEIYRKKKEQIDKVKEGHIKRRSRQ